MMEGRQSLHEGGRERRRRSPGLVVGMAISVLVHLLLIFLYPLWVLRITPGGMPPAASPQVVMQGTEILRVVEVEDQDEAAPVDEEEEEAPAAEPVRVPVPGAEGEPPATEPAEPEVPGGTPAERLRPNRENSRLWAPVDEELTELTPEERLQIEIEVELQRWNDSLATAAAAAAGATDWTHTDSKGNRWGISPGKLHLGKITLPLPIYFGPANGIARDRLAREAYELGDIDRGASTGAVRETMKERARAIRERKDAERAARMREEADTIRSN